MALFPMMAPRQYLERDMWDTIVGNESFFILFYMVRFATSLLSYSIDMWDTDDISYSVKIDHLKDIR